MTSFLKKYQLATIISNELLRKADAIICLEGDGLTRIPLTVKLYQKNFAKYIVLSGGYHDPPFSIPAKTMAQSVYKKGITQKRVIIESKSQNTYEQGIEVLKIVKKRKWKKIILVASHFHQLRAFLTFLKVMAKKKMKIQIYNAPARELSWFEKTSKGLTRFQLLGLEYKKINNYMKKGHLASFQQAIAYQKWKEKQL